MRKTLFFCLMTACGASPAPTVNPPPGGTSTTTTPTVIPGACADSLDQVYTVPNGLPGFSDSERGRVVRCAADRTLGASDVSGLLASWGYTVQVPQVGGEFTQSTTSLAVYRITYRTTRQNGREGVSSALAFVPPALRAGAPLIVAAHGPVGLADKCAPSKNPLDDANFKDAHALALGLASGGWAVIAPDYGGLGTGALSGMLMADDEAHALLDAPAALRHIFPAGTFGDSILMVGHSQGGHAVLAAQSMAATYRPAGTLASVAALAPPWFNLEAWVVALNPVDNLNTTDNALVLAYGLEYFYSHGEILDGVGGGVQPLLSKNRAAIESLLTGECFPEQKLSTIGKAASDLYDGEFIYEYNTCIATQKLCDVSKPVTTWRTRIRADRPALDPSGAPVVVWAGGQDQVVTPGHAKCGFDKMRLDLQSTQNARSQLTVCADPRSNHSSIVLNEMAWLQSWIMSYFAQKPVPVCGDEKTLQVGSTPLACDDLPVPQN